MIVFNVDIYQGLESEFLLLNITSHSPIYRCQLFVSKVCKLLLRIDKRLHNGVRHFIINVLLVASKSNCLLASWWDSQCNCYCFCIIFLLFITPDKVVSVSFPVFSSRPIEGGLYTIMIIIGLSCLKNWMAILSRKSSTYAKKAMPSIINFFFF